MGLVSLLLDALTLIIFLSAILSWFGPAVARSPATRALNRIVDPLLDPIRRPLPTTGVDFSPMVLIILLQIVRRWLGI